MPANISLKTEIDINSYFGNSAQLCKDNQKRFSNFNNFAVIKVFAFFLFVPFEDAHFSLLCYCKNRARD